MSSKPESFEVSIGEAYLNRLTSRDKRTWAETNDSRLLFRRNQLLYERKLKFFSTGSVSSLPVVWACVLQWGSLSRWAAPQQAPLALVSLSTLPPGPTRHLPGIVHSQNSQNVPSRSPPQRSCIWWPWCREWSDPVASRSCDMWLEREPSSKTQECVARITRSLRAHLHSPTRKAYEKSEWE